MNILGHPPVPPKTVFTPWVLASTKELNTSYDSFFQNLANKKFDFDSLTVMLNPQPEKPPLAEAAASGLNLLVTESPYLPVNSPFFSDMEKRGFLVRENGPQGRPTILSYQNQNSGLIDYTDPAAASYWHSLRRSGQVTSGASLFHLVGGEPESYNSLSWYQGVSDPLTHSHYGWGSRFSLNWMEGFGTGLTNQNFVRGETPRLFLLSRSGLAGLGRYGAGLFVAEPNVFFATGSGQARAHLNMSGVDYYATDVSIMLDQFPLTRSNQIYEAWLAKNVLVNLPLMLPVQMLDEPWAKLNFGIKAQLEPYYYSLAHRAYLTGDPIVAPLLYHFQDDELARDSAFEIMVGPYLMVAAGVNPGEEVLKFHLPAGRWYDVHGKDVIEQEKAGEFSLPSKLLGIHVAPLLLRAGAVVPTLALQPPSYGPKFLIRVFPGEQASSFDWYEDNGKNKNYQKGELNKTTLELLPGGQNNSLTFTIKATQGSVPSLPESRSYLVEFLGIGNVGVAYLDGEIYSRLAREEQLIEVDSGWVSAGTGRLLFKTPTLETGKDHVIVLN
jgi:alpha-glucosidase